jgi:hypothetical protein
MRRIVAAVIVLALCALPAKAAIAVCSSERQGQTEDIYRIDANESSVTVTYQYVPAGREAREAEILHHWHAGVEGGSSLGASFIMLRITDSRGDQLPPSMIVIDWTRLRFGSSYVPFAADTSNFVVARTDYTCVRLD